MYSNVLEGPNQHFCGWRDNTAYVFPYNTPTTRMDSQSAERFLALLRARDAGTLKTALSALGLLRQHDAQILPGEISIERLAQVMSGLCACFRLCKKYKGFQYLGTCRIFCRMGTCPHELCARYLESHPDVSMAHLSENTRHTARISVCGECAVATRTAKCLPATDRQSGIHTANCDARRHLHKYTHVV